MAVDIIIRKQSFRIKTGNEEEGLQLRHQLSQEWQYHFLLSMERLSHKLQLSNNETVYLDKVTVNLGRLGSADVMTTTLLSLETELYKRLAEALQSKTNTATSPTSSSVAENVRPNETSVGVDDDAALFYFLAHGYFPWWLAGPVSLPLLFRKNYDQQRQNLLLKLFSAITTRQHGWQKIIWRFIITLPEELFPSILADAATIQTDRAKKRSIQALMEDNIRSEIRNRFFISEKDYHRQLLYFLLRNAETDADLIRSFIDQVKQNTGQKNIHPPIGNTGDKAPARQLFFHELKEDEPTSQTAIDPKGIYITNAGLILLHPFLPALFDSGGLLTESKQFISHEARQYAAVWLQSLLNTDGEYEEWELPFNKIVCSLPADDVIPDDIIITQKDRDEGVELVSAVIGYWEALRGASAEAMAETFMRRAGKISWLDDHWLLQVERSGADILIDRLPWGLGVIRLPWLNALIYTEW